MVPGPEEAGVEASMPEPESNPQPLSNPVPESNPEPESKMEAESNLVPESNSEPAESNPEPKSNLEHESNPAPPKLSGQAEPDPLELGECLDNQNARDHEELVLQQPQVLETGAVDNDPTVEQVVEHDVGLDNAASSPTITKKKARRRRGGTKYTQKKRKAGTNSNPSSPAKKPSPKPSVDSVGDITVESNDGKANEGMSENIGNQKLKVDDQPKDGKDIQMEDETIPPAIAGEEEEGPGLENMDVTMEEDPSPALPQPLAGEHKEEIQVPKAM